MKPYLKTSETQITEYVDTSSGEIIDQVINKQTYVANTKEEFFLGYVTMLSKFSDIGISAVRTYAYLLLHYKPGTPFSINGAIKELIRDFNKSKAKSTTAIDSALKELVDARFLLKSYDKDNKRYHRGLYVINPEYAFKGSSNDRRKSIKAMFELEYLLPEGEYDI